MELESEKVPGGRPRGSNTSRRGDGWEEQQLRAPKKRNVRDRSESREAIERKEKIIKKLEDAIKDKTDALERSEKAYIF